MHVGLNAGYRSSQRTTVTARRGEQMVQPVVHRANGQLKPVVLAGVVAGVITTVWYCLEHYAQRHYFFDLRIYHNAVTWWLNGHQLYDYVQPRTGGFGFTYPPFAAVLMAPLSLVTLAHAGLVMSVITALGILVTTWWLVAPLAEQRGWPTGLVVALAVPLACLAEPLRETMGFGQINMILILLVLADWLALSRGSKFAGIGIGLAAAIKLTPAIFIAYLLVTGRRRAAAVATATAAAATLLTALVSPDTSWRYWTEALWQTSRVGRLDYASNQSLLGLLARLADPGRPDRLAWLVLVVVIVAVGFTRAARACAAGDDLAGFTLTGLTGCLICPISWTHHLYWVIPAIVICVEVGIGDERVDLDAVRRGGYLLLAGLTWWVFATSVIWPFNHRQGQHWSDGLIGVLGENAYVLLCVALLCLMPVRTLRTQPSRVAVRALISV